MSDHASWPRTIVAGSLYFAASFAWRSCSATGFYESTPVKMLELVSQLVPPGARVATVFERNTVFAQPRYRDGFSQRAEQLRLRPAVHEVASPADLDRMLHALAQDKPAALLILPGPMIFALHESIVRRAEALAVPAVYPFEAMAEAGGLMSFAPDLIASYRSAARYVDSVLRGAKPAELPIEQPTRLSLAVNVRTAKAKGLQLPDSILCCTDRRIE